MFVRKNLENILQELSTCRPIFHSEDDFKFALAWLIKDKYPEVKIRLEYPIRGKKNKFIDILLCFEKNAVPIELKYKTIKEGISVDGEIFNLKNHGAENENRYRFWRDIWRIETFRIENLRILKGFALFLTNNHRYWQGAGENRDDEAFRTADGIIRSKTLKWANPESKTGEKKEFNDPIKLTGQYALKWKDFSSVPDYPDIKFKYLLVEVTRKG